MNAQDLLNTVDVSKPLLGQVTELLRADTDWCRSTVDLLTSLSPAELTRLNRQDGETPGVDPRILTVAEREGVGLARVNLFSRERFLEFWRGGTLSPHYHRRSFATRILKGSYHHLLFDNAGSPDEPDLQLREQCVVRTGFGYALDWQDYHFVMFPADATVTLNIHLPPSAPTKSVLQPVPQERLVGLREEILESLGQESAVAP
ncbi:hypothetical protein P3T36_005249 [Kitasatospora sp. MAP12-15]|uniref:hypothetical protein n=1 Tax=unclassified Kitasatospora TaxID=2633591 RepID=UPI002472F0F3|nr:hypothetical protein [Kitasatospora sp. MAP12-44]MDH6113588.1 hypothetical protein [Kitasatospora sp. MAP12-44]